METSKQKLWEAEVNGIFYVMRAGCPWHLLPNDLPHWGTIYRWFATWRDDDHPQQQCMIERRRKPQDQRLSGSARRQGVRVLVKAEIESRLSPGLGLMSSSRSELP